MSEQIIPLVSSSVSGPLGIMHLPRLWLKILLHAQGSLPEGYRHGSGGFDGRLFSNLGIDGDAFVAYIETTKPDYLAVERWVREHATQIDRESIDAHNRYILAGELPTEIAMARCTEFGLADTSMRSAIALNNLDDWAAIHRQITAGTAR